MAHEQSTYAQKLCAYFSHFWSSKDQSEKITFFSLFVFIVPNAWICVEINHFSSVWISGLAYLGLRTIQGAILFIVLTLFGTNDVSGNIQLSIPYYGGMYWCYRFFRNAHTFLFH